MRMWIKQFVRGTHEIYWEGASADGIQQMVDGECIDILNDNFNDEEATEIISLTNSVYNSCKEKILTIFDNYRILKNTKVSNIFQTFGTGWHLSQMDPQLYQLSAVSPNNYTNVIVNCFANKYSHWQSQFNS